jgi:hypothetical protein
MAWRFLLSERSCKLIYAVVHTRFGAVPPDARRHIRRIIHEKTLIRLNVITATCPDLETFRKAVLSYPTDIRP